MYTIPPLLLLLLLLLLCTSQRLGTSLAAPLPDPTDNASNDAQLSQDFVTQLTDDWRLLSPSSPSHSYGFQNSVLNYTCPSLPCDHVPTMMREAILHYVAGTEHKSNFPMLIYRTCEAFHWCIPPSSFRISLHYEGKDEPKMFRPVLLFFRALKVDPAQWTGPSAHFTANTKMMHYLQQLRSVNDSSRLIYHLDLDEFPDTKSLIKAVNEMQAGECDAVRGYWCDRVSLNGAPNPVKISSAHTLQQQFPLRCNFSLNYMPERTTYKIPIYRSSLRVVSGQHVVWCDVDPNSLGRKGHGRGQKGQGQEKPYDWRTACTRHVNARVDKSSKASDILSLLPLPPAPQARPRVCKTLVPIDHYKWVRGVEFYLMKRVLAYKEKKLEWWKQSWRILEHINKHNGRICVKCGQNACIYMGTE